MRSRHFFASLKDGEGSLSKCEVLNRMESSAFNMYVLALPFKQCILEDQTYFPVLLSNMFKQWSLHLESISHRLSMPIPNCELTRVEQQKKMTPCSSWCNITGSPRHSQTLIMNEQSLHLFGDGAKPIM